MPGEKLKSGDILNIDVTVIRDGFHGDTSRMYYVGKPDPARRCPKLPANAMWRGIEEMRPGNTWATSATPSRLLRKSRI